MEWKYLNNIEKENINILLDLYHGNHLSNLELERAERILKIMDLELKRRLN